MLSAVTESGLPACFTFYADSLFTHEIPIIKCHKAFLRFFSYLAGIILFLLAKFCFLQCYTESNFIPAGLRILKNVYIQIFWFLFIVGDESMSLLTVECAQGFHASESIA
jgi:hypothetical protein